MSKNSNANHKIEKCYRGLTSKIPTRIIIIIGLVSGINTISSNFKFSPQTIISLFCLEELLYRKEKVNKKFGFDNPTVKKLFL